MSARMDPGELQAVREYLGLTTAHLAVALSVRHDTVRRWESGRDPIPHRVREEVVHLEQGAQQYVDSLAGDLQRDHAAVAHVYRTDAALHAAMPATYPMPARWWRHVVVRAIDQAGRAVMIVSDETADTRMSA